VLRAVVALTVDGRTDPLADLDPLVEGVVVHDQERLDRPAVLVDVS
jgi:hypothetical protein